MKCRICRIRACMMHESTVSVHDDNYRDGFRMADLTRKSHVPFMKMMTKPLNSRNVLTAEESDVMEELKNEGMLPGYNPLHSRMQFSTYHGISDIFSAQLPDMMHTLLKGITERNISSTATMIYIYNGRSLQCLSEVDDRLINSAFQQSVNPFSKKSRFRDGTLCLLCYVYLRLLTFAYI
jgi:hypothetical protein